MARRLGQQPVATISPPSPLTTAADGVRLAVRLTPRAGADRIDGVAALADGVIALKVAVAAPPADSRANEALLRLLARAFDLPRRDLAIVGGHKSRNKIVHLSGEPSALMQRLGFALGALSGH